MERKLRITFVIPFTYLSGGIAVVLEYYRQLTAMGHDVRIFYPLLPYDEYLGSPPPRNKFLRRVRVFLSKIKHYVRTISLFAEDIPVKSAVCINNAFIPDADAVIATAWPTAYDVNRLSPRKGRKFYFVQGYEIWYGSVKEVDASYRLPLNIITIAPWLTELMKEKFNRNDVTEINNGIRLDKFYPPTRKDFGQASILLMASVQELKGTTDAIDALTIVKERHPHVKITMFGMCERPNAPFDFEYHQDPPYDTLLSLYQNAAVFIFPSHGEGWGITPMEAMACKCAVVATNVGCIPILNNGENLILADVKNPSSIADGIIKLLEDITLMERIAERGLKSIREQDWTASARTLINCLRTSDG
jgi:hypothetical protein